MAGAGYDAVVDVDDEVSEPSYPPTSFMPFFRAILLFRLSIYISCSSGLRDIG